MPTNDKLPGEGETPTNKVPLPNIDRIAEMDRRISYPLEFLGKVWPPSQHKKSWIIDFYFSDLILEKAYA